jgi:hypothetical protein
VGTRRGSLGISVLAEPCTPSRNLRVKSPVQLNIGSINGYRPSPALQDRLSSRC